MNDSAFHFHHIRRDRVRISARLADVGQPSGFPLTAFPDIQSPARRIR